MMSAVIKNVTRAMAAFGLVAGVMAAMPGSARAAGDVHGCSEGQYCFYSEADFQGKKKEVRLQPYTCYKATVGWPDGSSSRPVGIVNNRTEISQLEGFDNDACSGRPYAHLRYREGVARISDRAKSFRVAPRCDIGSVCLYENKDFSGRRWQINPTHTNRCFHAGDDVWGHGFYNATRYTATFYRSVFCTMLPTTGQAPGSFGTFDEKVHLVKID
ncbi:hypothetical protein GCM10009787_09050 [Streptomyces bangladeshensis]|uniref:Peptidase inhibitor family I36 n=1 Tax=Streptomyces bangladeshensis TaxID=295352 RepID=A0ABN3BBP9_9ACTN